MTRRLCQFFLACISAVRLLTAGPLHAASPAPVHETYVTLPGRDVSFTEQLYRLPVEDGTILEATLLLPQKQGPFPLAIVSGGARSVSSQNRGTRDRFTFLAAYFLARGYAVFEPMARGFAGSEGALISTGCQLSETARLNAQDIRTVSATISALPEIDNTRIVTAGISFGGWLQMAMGTQPLPGTRAQLLFYPLVHVSSCHGDSDRLIAGAREFGADTTLPTLWVQGENDSLLPTSVWKEMFAVYRQGNPHAELVDVPPFKQDSHAMLSDPDGLKPWTAQADALLQKVGLPAGIVLPDYLPVSPPEASGYAALGDFGRLPVQTDAVRKAYTLFLSEKSPRAFAIGQSAAVVNTDQANPVGEAMAACRKVSSSCQLYAYDDRVVWRGGPLSLRKEEQVTLPPGKVATIFFNNLNPDCTPRFVPAVHLVTPPRHGVAVLRSEVSGMAHYTQGELMKCNATPVTGSGFQYRANAGFHGADSVTLTRQSSADPHDPPLTLTYNFTIQ